MSDQVTRTNGTAARIRELRRELAGLEQQLRDELKLTIEQVLSAYDPGQSLTTSALWEQNDVRTACIAAGIHSAQELGKWLRRSGLVEYVYRANTGRVWSVNAAD